MMNTSNIAAVCSKAAGRQVTCTIVAERRGPAHPGNHNHATGTAIRGVCPACDAHEPPPDDGLIKASHLRFVDGQAMHEIDLASPDGTARSEAEVIEIALSWFQPPSTGAP